MGVFIAYPWLAFVIAVAFFGAWLWRRVRSAAFACALWTGYGVYEYLMRARILCSGECNIRVDLLIIYPLLLCVSLFAAWRAFRRRTAAT